MRFGFDALIGLFPAVGDLITTALSLFIVHEAYQLGAPSHVIARMLGNVALDGVLGKWALKEQRYGRHFNAIRFQRTTVAHEDAIERSKEIYGHPQF